MTDPTLEQPDEPPRQPRPLAMPGGTEKRRFSLIIIGVVLVVGTGFGFWFTLQSVDERLQYVVSSRALARWEQVGPGDFRTVEADVGDAAAMTPDQVSAIFGQWATGTIPADTFVTPGMFRSPPLSSEAESRSIVIQVSLPAEDVTYGTLAAGDTIALIGRESLQPLDDGLGDNPAAATGDLTLIGMLRLDHVQGGAIIYVVEPAQALEIQNLVRRYLAAQDRQIWRLGSDLTADDVRRALSGESAPDIEQ